MTTVAGIAVSAVAKAFNEKLTRNRGSRSIKTWARAMEWAKGKVVREVGLYSCLARQPVEVQVVEKEEVI